MLVRTAGTTVFRLGAGSAFLRSLALLAVIRGVKTRAFKNQPGTAPDNLLIFLKTSNTLLQCVHSYSYVGILTPSNRDVSQASYKVSPARGQFIFNLRNVPI
jgi:hypothetical protein